MPRATFSPSEHPKGVGGTKIHFESGGRKNSWAFISSSSLTILQITSSYMQAVKLVFQICMDTFWEQLIRPLCKHALWEQQIFFAQAAAGTKKMSRWIATLLGLRPTTTIQFRWALSVGLPVVDWAVERPRNGARWTSGGNILI